MTARRAPRAAGDRMLARPNFRADLFVGPDMKCPVDSNDLIMSERSGVEIDYCPQCRGVWLDRGELDKIIDRAAQQLPAAQQPSVPLQAPPPATQPPLYRNFDPRYGDQRGRQDEGDRYPEGDRYQQPGYGRDRRRKKKEGWLGDLFDF